MNLIERIKSRENIDPIELFDISDTKEIINNNYTTLIAEIKQLQVDEQKRVEEHNRKFEIDLNNAINKDTTYRLKQMKISIIIFFISLCFSLPIFFNLLSININIYKYIFVGIRYYVKLISLISLTLLPISFSFFIAATNKKNYKDNQNKVKQFYENTKDIDSLTGKIKLYILLFKELNEIHKLFNNSALKQNEIITTLLALKTNYETRKFQQEMLNKKDMEISIQESIAEYNRQQMKSQQRQEEYAKQQMKSQRNQEEYARQQNQVIQEEKRRRETLRRGY
jgi:hypothetical protein